MSSQSKDIPEGCRMTELGPLPEEWEVVRLGDITIMKQGQVLPVNKFHQTGYPVFGANGQIGFYNKYTHYESEVLVTCRGSTCGFVNVSPPKSFVTNNAMVVTPMSEDRLTKNYLAFTLQTAVFSNTITGTGQPQITKGKLALVAIPLPPFPEQKEIAGVLSNIQKAIEAQDKTIASARELKKSLMRHLFTYGTVSVAEAENVPLKETEIRPAPEHWEVVRLGEVTEKPEYGYTATASREIVGLKYLRITDIQNGVVDWSSVPSCQCPPEDIDKYQLHFGDILFARIGATTGKTYFVEDCPTAVFASYLIRVRCKSSLLPAYLNQFTTTQNYWDQIDALKGDRLKHGINTPNLKGLLIPLPSLPEQQEIAHTLSTVDSKIEAEENYRSALQALFRTMLHQLMTGKVRVKDLGATAA